MRGVGTAFWQAVAARGHQIGPGRRTQRMLPGMDIVRHPDTRVSAFMSATGGYRPARRNAAKLRRRAYKVAARRAARAA